MVDLRLGRHGNWNLVDAFHRHAGVQAASSGELRLADGVAVLFRSGTCFLPSPLSGKPQENEQSSRIGRRRHDGVRNCSLTLHGHAGDADDGRVPLQFHVVALSVVFALAFSYSALRIAFYFRDATAEARRKIGSAFFMGSAICAMHYTGMAATTFAASAVEPDLTQSVSVSILGTIGIIIVTLLILGLAMLSSLVDRRFEAQAFRRSKIPRW
jgi:hypothetical protein